MKVLFINGVYGHGSTGTIVKDIELLCEQNGIECYVASPDIAVRSAKRGYVIGNIFDHKLHALLCRVNGKQAYFSYFATRKLIEHIEHILPDIVHLHTLHGNYINMPMLLTALASNNIRTIVTMHDCWYYTGGCFHYSDIQCYKWQKYCNDCPKKKNDTPAYFLDKSRQILADRKRLFDAIPNLTITGVSRWICEESKKGIFYDKYVIPIHNGVDFSIFKPTNLLSLETKIDIESLSDSSFTILGLAGKWLDPINRDAFLYILGKLQPSEHFILFGYNERIESQMQFLNITKEQRDKIITIEYTKNRKQLAALYSIADVFINCTREDSFSLINVEAQACGTPIVTYSSTGAQETVDNKCSFGVKTGDYKEMWEKIALIQNKGKRHYSDDCILWVKENFDMHNNYQKYLSLYTSLCENRSI